MSWTPKRALRRLYTAADVRIREWRVRSLVRKLRRAPLSAAAILPIVARLRQAWGNPSWSADLGFLEELVTRSLDSRGPFLECGSGLSTVILGVLAERRGAPVWSLEQDREWWLSMRTRLQALDLQAVQLRYAPLEIVDGAAWYGLDDPSLPRAFSTVFCDGPSVTRSNWPEPVFHAWRVGAVGGLQRRGATFETVVLDDAEDRRCAGLIAAWRSAGLQVEIIETRFGRHVVARRASGEPVPMPAAT